MGFRAAPLQEIQAGRALLLLWAVLEKGTWDSPASPEGTEPGLPALLLSHPAHGTALITLINTSLPTHCDNHCLLSQPTPLLGFCAFCYLGQTEG